ncbi:Allantoinase [Bienertia sinuspersici]
MIVQTSQSDCSLLSHNHYWITSKRIVTQDGVISGAVEIKDGKVFSLVKEEDWLGYLRLGHIVDFGEAVVMPGLIDVHAHMDDPGRDEWEGFPSGGITTLIDMPLNSEPSTVSEETLNLKIKAAKNRIYVDVGFWGGLVPENAFNATALERLLRAGALGLKSFMCPSGINDFPMTNITHIKEGLSIMAKFKRPLLVHAEVKEEDVDYFVDSDKNDARKYSTYLHTRPPSMEEAAIRNLLTKAKSRGDSITMETCPHYLAFSADDIPDGDTRFKCAPPIRDADNKDKLWEALRGGDIDMLSSDHSPALPEFKLLQQGDFLKAWGGISSLQYVLPATWTAGREHGVTFEQIASWWSEKPAKLAGQQLKGSIAVGNYADIVAWDPDSEFHLNDNHTSYIKHPVSYTFNIYVPLLISVSRPSQPKSFS